MANSHITTSQHMGVPTITTKQWKGCKTNYQNRDVIYWLTFLRTELFSMTPDQPFSFCYGQLAGIRWELCLTFTPLTVDLILCITPHCPQNKSLGLTALISEKTPYGGNETISRSLTRALWPWHWVLISFFSWTSITITQSDFSLWNCNTATSICFVFELLALYNDIRTILSQGCQHVSWC